MATRRLVFDIETAARDLADFDDYSQKKLAETFDVNEDAEEEKLRMAFSPLTAQVVTIAALDADTEKGGVYMNGAAKSFEENGVKFEGGDERVILKKFWELAPFYDEFVTFAGRTFDVPVLMVRSAILGVRPTKNLMSNRYASSQPANARHLDLRDQLTFYGAKNERLGLHFWCVAFGIPSPKLGEVTGEDVTRLWKAGEHEKIARYCLGDTRATLALFRKWEDHLRFDAW